MVMGRVAPVLLVVAAVVVLVVAYRLDEQRITTGRGLWRVVRDRFADLGRGEGERSPRRAWGGRIVALLPLVVVAAALAAGAWWVAERQPGEPTAGQPAAAAPDDAPRTVPTATPAGETASTVTAPGIDGSVVEAAVALSREAFPDGEASDVLLTRDELSVDALAAGGLLGRLNGPLLLTASDQVPPETLDEIERLGRPSIHILGGEAAVSPEVEAQLVDAGLDVRRVAGPTGIETAIAAAAEHFSDAEEAVLVPTFSAEDATAGALAGAGLAAAREVPVLLTASGGLSGPTAEYLAASGITSVTVVGSDELLTDGVVDELTALGVAATRAGGADPYATAAAIVRDTSLADLGSDVVLLADGGPAARWPVLSLAAVHAGREGAPTLLSDGDALPQPTREALAASDSPWTTVRCLPGVSKTACEEARGVLTERG